MSEESLSTLLSIRNPELRNIFYITVINGHFNFFY